jgi:predicted secreted hydrolase
MGRWCCSYYYSQPFYQVSGTLKLPDGPVSVTGQAWLDREWSSQPLASDQTGWDWFSLHFATGEKLMGFRLKDSGDGFSSATWIGRDGTPEPQTPGTLRLTPLAKATVANREVPVRWRVELPTKGVDIETVVLNEQAWMTTRFPYWEGPIFFTGSHSGRGYLEMTGYK